jgi:hypothetical protein
MNTAKNEVNGIADALPSQLWAFGPRSNQPRKFDASTVRTRVRGEMVGLLIIRTD